MNLIWYTQFDTPQPKLCYIVHTVPQFVEVFSKVNFLISQHFNKILMNHLCQWLLVVVKYLNQCSFEKAVALNQEYSFRNDFVIQIPLFSCN